MTFQGADKSVSRTRFLFVSYALTSPLLNHLALEDQLFLVDVNQKIREHNPEIDIYWGKVTRTNIVTALSLIRHGKILSLNLKVYQISCRNVFDCDTDTESLLLTSGERDACQQHVYRGAHVSHMAMRDLEPILANYRTQLKVVILHQDPRTVYRAERVVEDARSFGARMCIQMMRDMERMIEFSTYSRYRRTKWMLYIHNLLRNSFSVFSEEVFLLFSEKILADFLKFLEVESSTDIKLSKSRLQHLFIQHYSWKENSTSDTSLGKIDEKCQGLYELSIYKPLKHANTFSFKGENYPLIFKLKI